MEKLLSIIVPSYNMEKYLPKCLGSLVVPDVDLLQSLDVVVVNDGSKDRTSEIAHEFETRHPGVFRVIDKANGNYGSCINAGLPIAVGRFVKILDADDTYDTAAFTRYLRALATLPTPTDMVVNDFVQVDETGHVTKSMTFSFPTDAAFNVQTILDRDCFIAMHAVAYRTTLLREIGYRQTEGISYTDTEWTYLPVAYAREIRFVPESVYRYLVGRDGQTVSRASIARNVRKLDFILDGMLKQYETISCSTTVKEYLKWRIRKTFGVSISWHLTSVFSPGLGDFLRWLRQKTEAFDFLAENVHEWSILASTPFRFRYADFMLRHPRLARTTLLLVSVYARLRAKQ